jgi:hypothetical protein
MIVAQIRNSIAHMRVIRMFLNVFKLSETNAEEAARTIEDLVDAKILELRRDLEGERDRTRRHFYTTFPQLNPNLPRPPKDS